MVNFAQEVDLATWLGSGVTREGHIKSICWKLKVSMFRDSSRDLVNLRDALTSWILSVTFPLLYPHYIYFRYPQNFKEAIQKKTLERGFYNTHLVRESYSSSKEKSL